MTISDLGNLGEFIASLGVLISLVYLAAQVRQNSSNLQVNAYQDLIGRITDVNRLMATDPVIPVLIEKARAGEELQSTEWQKYFALLMMVMRNGDMAYFQFEKGLLSPARMRSIVFPLLLFIRSDVGRAIWDRQTQFDPGFRHYIDDLIANATDREMVAWDRSGSID